MDNNNLKYRMFNQLSILMTRLDPEVFNPLLAHAGKIIHLDITGLLSLYIKIQPDTLELCDDTVAPQCHTSLSGRLSDFMLSSKPNSPSFRQGGLTLKGDLNCAKAFDDCLKQMDLDWEGYFAGKIGDNAAVALSSFLKKTTQYLKTVVKTRSADCVYYAQDEKQFVPLKEEVQAFYTDVDQLKMDVERFEAKLKDICFDAKLKSIA